MPVVMELVWEGVTPEQYDEAFRVVDVEGNVPPGLMYHVASFTDGAIHVTDIWESAEQFQDYVQSRLMPGLQQLGFQGEPRVEIRPTHRVFAPGYTPR